MELTQKAVEKARQERLKRELDPDNQQGILATLIRCIQDDWNTEVFSLDSCGFEKLAYKCSRYESRRGDDRTLFQLEFHLFDSIGEYFDFFQDICSPSTIIMNTARLEHLDHTLLFVDIAAAIEDIKSRAKRYLES